MLIDKCNPLLCGIVTSVAPIGLTAGSAWDVTPMMLAEATVSVLFPKSFLTVNRTSKRTSPSLRSPRSAPALDRIAGLIVIEDKPCAVASSKTPANRGTRNQVGVPGPKPQKYWSGSPRDSWDLEPLKTSWLQAWAVLGMASNEATTNGADALGWLCPTHGKINNKDVKNPGIQQALRQADSSTSHQNEIVHLSTWQRCTKWSKLTTMTTGRIHAKKKYNLCKR